MLIILSRIDQIFKNTKKKLIILINYLSMSYVLTTFE
jgi:hypothetical protein